MRRKDSDDVLPFISRCGLGLLQDRYDVAQYPSRPHQHRLLGKEGSIAAGAQFEITLDMYVEEASRPQSSRWTDSSHGGKMPVFHAPDHRRPEVDAGKGT